MKNRFDEQVEVLNTQMIEMGAMIETTIEGACDALLNGDLTTVACDALLTYLDAHCELIIPRPQTWATLSAYTFP